MGKKNLMGAADRLVLADVVRYTQKQSLKGSDGGWKDYLARHDKTLGSGVGDPAKRPHEFLLAFLRTFPPHLQKYFETMIKRSEDRKMLLLSNDSHPHMSLVSLTERHPDFARNYVFPSYKEEWEFIKLSKTSEKVDARALIAIRCHTVLCADGTEALVRVCAVDQKLEVILDRLVNPKKPVKNYRTTVTGLSAEDLDGVTCLLADVQKSLKQIFKKDTILVGYRLFNDLQALQVDFPLVVDTASIFSYSKLSTRQAPSLNNLCLAVLGKTVPKERMRNCIEEAKAAMKLVLAKLERGLDQPISVSADSASDHSRVLLLEALDWKLMHEKDPIFGQSNSFSLESAVNEENEFLRLQAIQNEHEIESLRKKLNLALEAKGHLERHVEELTTQLEEAKSSFTTKQEELDPEMELKAMVHAIAAASQREAEAHETTISLAKENEDLKLQLSAVMEDSRRGGTENLEVQLHDMHHENEKLLGLYEDAMHERDELGRLVQEMKEREELVIHERDSLRKLIHDMEEKHQSCLSKQIDIGKVVDEDVNMCIDISKETLELVRTKLELVQDKLLSADKAVGHMQLIEDASSEIDELSTVVKSVHKSIEPKEQSLKELRSVLCQKQGKRDELENLFSSLVSELNIINSSACYLKERETRTTTKVIELKAYLNEKEKELSCLQTHRQEICSAYKKARENESKLRNRIDTLKTSLKSVDDFRKDSEKVLTEVKNFKASDLLNSEMQRGKLVHEMNSLREQMGAVQKEVATLTKSRETVEQKISCLDILICNWSQLVRELEGMLDEMRVIGSTNGHVRDQIEKLLPDYQEALFEVELKNEEIAFSEQSLCEERSALDDVSGKLSLVVEKLKDILCQRKCVVPDLHNLKGNSISLSEMVAKQLHEACELVGEAKQLSVVSD